MYSGNEIIGSSGSGTFNQTGGWNNITRNLMVGSGSGSTGQYNLSGTGRLDLLDTTGTYGREVVGSGGTGTFTQTGGDNTAAYLSVGGGSGSNGTFTQSDGTTTITGGLYVGGYATDSTGVYNLSGAGTLSAPFESVGGSGTATFTQTGGTNTMTQLSVDYGTYTLGGGALSGSGEAIGDTGTGTFTQTGGTNTVTSLEGGFILGNGPGATGTYNLSDTGVLSTVFELVGRYGSGTFNQSGGTHTTNTLGINGSSTYNLSGGTLYATSIVNNGQFNYSGGSFNGAITNNATFTLSGTGTRTVNGSVTNDTVGTVNVTGTTASFNWTFTNYGTLKSDAATLGFFYGGLIVGPAGKILASPGDQYLLYGNFTANNTAGWDTSHADLSFPMTMVTQGPLQLSFGALDVMTWNSLTVGTRWLTLNTTGTFAPGVRPSATAPSALPTSLPPSPRVAAATSSAAASRWTAGRCL